MIEENEFVDETTDETMENDTPKNEQVDDEPNASEPEKAEKSEKEIKSLLAQKEHWRKKFEAEVANKPKAPASSESEWKHKVEFLLDNRDVTDDEFEHLAAVALRRSGSITMDSLRNAQKQENDYISYKRKKEEDKKKVPGSTSTGYESKIKSAKDIAKMNEEEFKAYEAEMMEEGSSGI
jgi:hypothetical protein